MPDPSGVLDGLFCEEREPALLGDGVARWSGFLSKGDH
jgi:hypothetical protein